MKDTDGLPESKYQEVIDDLIKRCKLEDVDKREAELICLSWLLKTKYYLLGETSYRWSKKGRELFEKEFTDAEKLIKGTTRNAP